VSDAKKRVSRPSHEQNVTELGATVKSKFFSLLTAIALTEAAAFAGAINMDDPRRTVGREDDVRVDAQLIQDTVTAGSPIGITYQIENLSDAPVAIADKVAEATYDSDTYTITVAIGSEIPKDGKMPKLATIAPGEKKIFRAGATPALHSAITRGARSAPRYVQVKVSILRDMAAFSPVKPEQMLSDAQFDRWLEANDSIFLNAVPVRFAPNRATSFVAADQRGTGAF
jgi:hypothetical protein